MFWEYNERKVHVVMLKGEKGDMGASGDYATLINKPKINSVELNGNKTSTDLGLSSATALEVERARINQLVAEGGVTKIATKRTAVDLWTDSDGRFSTIGDTITLSDNVSNYSQIDVHYIFNGKRGAQTFEAGAGQMVIAAPWIPESSDSAVWDSFWELIFTLSNTTGYVVNSTLVEHESQRHVRTSYIAETGGAPATTKVTKIVGIKYEDAGADKDTEVTDIRVAADGTVYPTAGDAVRGQVGALNDAVDALSSEIDGAFITHTLSGPVVTFESSGAPLKSLKADISLYQEGAGDPAPSRYTKNVFNLEDFEITVQGPFDIDWDMPTGTLTFTAREAITTTANITFAQLSRQIEPANYTLSVANITGKRNEAIYAARSNAKVYNPSASVTNFNMVHANQSTTFTTSTAQKWLWITFADRLSGQKTYEAGEQIKFTFVQMEAGSEKTAFEPHFIEGNIRPIKGYGSAKITVNDSVIEIPFEDAGAPATVYAGNVDATTGVLTSNYGNIASYNGETINEPWLSSMDVYEAGKTPTTGAQVVYQLSSPLIYQLEPVQIQTQEGTNTVFADTGDVTITYRSDLSAVINDIYSKISALDARVTALEERG